MKVQWSGGCNYCYKEETDIYLGRSGNRILELCIPSQVFYERLIQTSIQD